MPTYNFKNKVTGEEFTKFLMMSEVDTFLKENPDVEQTISGFSGVGDPWRMGMKKPDESFRDILRTIKKNYPRSRVNTF